MKNTFIQTGNSYLYHPANHKQLIISDILSEIINQKKNGLLVDYQVELPDFDYYLAKYQFLENYGYFDEIDLSNTFTEGFSPEAIQFGLQNATNIVFETTENCNLNCVYCGYGHLR